MQAYEGYFENGQFYPIGQTAHIKGRRRAFITILEEPPMQLKTIDKDEYESRAAWLKRLKDAIDLSLDEEFPFLSRSQEMHEPVNLTNEE